MNTRFRITGLALAALTLPFHAGCRSHPNAPTPDPIVQTVRIEPTEPREGETITVYSTIENRGSKPQQVTYLICQLAMGGDLALTMVPGTARCAGFSASAILAPGQRLEAGDSRVVVSGPGAYTLDVTHVIDPERTTTLTVRVRN